MSVEINGKHYSWNAAICVADWNMRNPDRLAEPKLGEQKFVGGEVNRCVYCGGGTTSGIFVRVDPRTVPFPALEDDDSIRDIALPIGRALAQEIDG